MKQALTIHRWGSSPAVRIPRDVLDRLGLVTGDKLTVNIDNGAIILRPAKKNGFEELFKDYDASQPYPFEFVGTGDATGRELD